jgi:hypothetical protein
MDKSPVTVDALRAAIREQHRTIEELWVEIERLTTATVLLLADEVSALRAKVDGPVQRMAALDGVPPITRMIAHDH